MGVVEVTHLIIYSEGEQIKTQNEIREQEGIVARYEMVIYIYLINFIL